MSISFFNGDCLQVMKDLPDASIDCFICDLPYGCLRSDTKRTKSEIFDTKARWSNWADRCDWDIPLNLDEFWKNVRRLRRSDNTPCLMFCSTKFGISLINSNLREFRYDLVWNKRRGVSPLSVNTMPMRSHEMVYIFSKAGAFYNRVDIAGDFKAVVRSDKNLAPVAQYGGTVRTPSESKAGFRSALSVINNPTSSRIDGHPTEKPMELYKFLIERYCPVDGVLLDPTAGSFNSCFTAYELGRDAIGIEKDSKFFRKAKERAETMLGSQDIPLC